MENRLYGVLAEMYHEQRDIETAYEYLALQTALTELLAERLASVKVTGMKNFHEREDRRRQLNSLYFENQIIKLKLDEQKSAQMQLAAVVLLVTTFLIILIFMFLSKRKTLLLVNAQRRELESLVATKNKFFSIISHDLRGPLGGTMQLIATAIELYPELSREKILELLKSMNETSRKTYLLLENLLVWSRFQTGAMQVKRQNIDLAKFIDDEVSMQEAKAKTKGIDLKNLSRDKVLVFADLDMLGTILRNLLSNAVKFTPEGGKVLISVNRIESRVEVSVKDTGIGIPASQFENIFSLENQFNRKGTKGEESNGLGLILVREFVEELGGHIDVESVEGEGTTFTFSLQTLASTTDSKEIDSQA
ncbi:MAG: HAMP domain-containing histidine kinase [Candidatus Marinimicrobia bacterium]|nr:HAMP domain-containing histidine kinase [Candidatus Neomarinimicrobiota bacterium]